MKRILLALVVSLALCASAQAAVAVDSQESSGLGHNSGTSPLTWSFTNTAGNFMVVGVDLSQQSPGNAPTIGAVSYNGVAMTQIGSTLVWTGDATSSTQMALFGLASPATGAHTVSVAFTFALSPTAFDCIAGAVSFSGVDTAAPTGTAVSTFDATIGGGGKSVNVTGTTSGNKVVSLVATGSGSAVAGTAPTTVTWALPVSSHTFSDDAAMGTQSAGGTQTVAYTGSTDYWGIIAVEILASGGAPPTCQSTFTLLGVSRCGDH